MERRIIIVFLTYVFFGLAPNNLQASPADVPDAVKTTFKQRYSSAQKTVWEEKDDQYKATFQYQGKKMFAFFDHHGSWMKSFTKVGPKDLPVSVMLYIQEHLDGYELSRQYLRADTEIESYAVAVRKGAEYVWMQFDLDGKFISSQV